MSKFVRTILIWLGATFTVLCPLAAAASSVFTGQFLADNRPRELIYVSITQAGHSVSGFMILVSAADKGKTEKKTLALDGVADKTTITLREKRFFGDYVLTGRKNGHNLVLFFPGKDGGIIPKNLISATESEYTNKLSEWQRLHAEIYKEQSIILKHASALSEQIRNIENTEIPKLLLEAKKSLSTQKSVAASFQEKRERFLKITEASASIRCNFVYSHVSPLFYSDMSGYFYSDFSPADMRYQKAISEISRRIDSSSERIVEASNDATLLKDAISRRQFPLPKLPSLPGDVQLVFDKYIALANRSELEVESIKAQYIPIENEVRTIMRESEREIKAIEANCRN